MVLGNVQNSNEIMNKYISKFKNIELTKGYKEFGNRIH